MNIPIFYRIQLTVNQYIFWLSSQLAYLEKILHLFDKSSG